MTVEQYTAFVELMPDIERVLKSKGLKAPRPQYDKSSTTKEPDDELEASDEVEEEDEREVSSKHKGKLEKFKMKKNHEATSDEEDEE